MKKLEINTNVSRSPFLFKESANKHQLQNFATETVIDADIDAITEVQKIKDGEYWFFPVHKKLLQ